ncbi:MAG: hypothetical protein ACXWZS_00950 [Gemmatirosa sp.]
MRRSLTRTALPLVFALLAVDAWQQVVLDGVLAVRDPRVLTALKVVAGTAAAAASWGSWRRARWAPLAAGSWALATAALLVAVGPALGLGPEGRPGLWAGAAAVLAFGLGTAWHLTRTAPAPRRGDPARPAG